MNGNNFFNFSRFGLLCRKEFIENRKSILLRMFTFFGMMFLFFILVGINTYSNIDNNLTRILHYLETGEDPMWNAVFFIGYIFLMTYGCFSASLIMEKMERKMGRIALLITPASSFEKFMSKWIFAVLVAILFCFFAFLLADYMRVGILQFVYPKLTNIIHPVDFTRIFSYGRTGWSVHDKELLGIFVSIFFMLQSFFVLGGVVWPKKSFFKTFLFCIIVPLGYMLFDALLSTFFYRIDIFEYRENIPFISEHIEQVFMIFFGCVTVFNWVLAYYRFKESEVIHRLV